MRVKEHTFELRYKEERIPSNYRADLNELLLRIISLELICADTSLLSAFNDSGVGFRDKGTSTIRAFPPFFSSSCISIFL